MKMYENPWVHLRGALGDLIILLPILKKMLYNEYGTNKCNVLVTGPMCQFAVQELFYLQDAVEPCSIIANQQEQSGQWSTFVKGNADFETLIDRKFDIQLNHVTAAGVSKADQIYPGVDFTDINFSCGDLPDDIKRTPYVVISPFGRSNQYWSTESNLLWFTNIINECLSIPDMVVYLIGKHPSNAVYDAVSPAAFAHRAYVTGSDKLRIRSWYNQTTLRQTISLIAGSKGLYSYDNGIKNIGYVMKDIPCYARIDTTWTGANPIEAWSPPSLVTKANNNFITIHRG